MQYYDQREKTLKRIIKIAIIIVVIILCITGICLLINLNINEQNALSISEQKEQQRVLTLRPLYEEKSKLERQLSNITFRRSHALERSTVFILLLTDCSETLVHKFSTMLQPNDCPAVICISDSSYPGAEGCISVKEAKELVERRWEFMIDISSDADRLTDLLQSYALTKPVAIYNPNKETDNENISHDLPHVNYGNQNDKTLFNAVYGMQDEDFTYAGNTALANKTSIIMTVGTVLPREIYNKELLQRILSFVVSKELQICTYSENTALHAQYIQQQQKVVDETEEEYQSLSEALKNIEVQIEKIEKDLLK